MLALRAQGASLKVIGYELGVSLGTVSRELTLTMARLGLESCADLAAVLGHVETLPASMDGSLPPPRGLYVERVATACAEYLVLSMPLANEPRLPAGLTSAERLVVEGILAGLANAEIARQRGVSPRTVANQIGRVFAKLRISSRLELALSIHREAVGALATLTTGGVAA
jgi:DNA-binding NarL/FixJ family response regulator